MTQNTYSSSFSNQTFSNQKRDDDDNQSSNEIRADIDQTRAAVGEKIDQLQARLDPSRLKAQAQETVQEMLSDTAQSVTDYFRSHKDEMVTSIADAARRNPLPTALVGLGLGWLLLESMAGSKRHDHEWEYQRRNFRARGRFDGSTGRSFVSQGRGQYMEEDYYSPEYYDSPEYASTHYTQTGSAQPDYGRSGSPTYSEPNAEFHDSQEYGNGHRRHGNPLAKAAGAVKETVSDVGEEIKERVEDAGEEIKERVSDVKERISGTVQDVRQQASHMSHQGQRSLHRMGDQMDEWRYRARYEGRRRGRQVIRNLEDNPLTYGALALAAGAALAILLPQTRAENRAFGEMRDRMVERGQEVFEDAKHRAQEVAQEIRPELEQKAREIVSEAKEMGKEMVKEAADELRPVVDKAMERGKEEARSLAQEAGVDPDKLTGSKGGSSSTMTGSSTASSSTASAATSSPSLGRTGTSTMPSTGTSRSASTPAMGSSMGQGAMPVINRDTLAGQWKQIKGQVKSKWGQLTDDDLTQAEGNYEKLVGKLQTRYGYTRERAERELDDFFKSCKI